MSYATRALILSHKSACRMSGVTLSIRRGDTVLVPSLVALPGKTSAESIDPRTGLSHEVELQDWILLAELLQHNGTPVLLQRGDLIETRLDDVVTGVFAVHHPNTSQPPFRRSDVHGLILRVHTVGIEMPAADEPEQEPEDETGDE